jgi:hypothetical protein
MSPRRVLFWKDFPCGIHLRILVKDRVPVTVPSRIMEEHCQIRSTLQGPLLNLQKQVQRTDELDAKLREAIEMNRATNEELRQLKERLGLLENAKAVPGSHQIISLLPPSLPLTLPTPDRVETQPPPQEKPDQPEAQEAPKQRTGWLSFL